MNTDDDDEHSFPQLPWDALGPLIAWMSSNRVDRLHLVAQPAPSAVVDEAPYLDESAYFFHCEKAPEAPGLLNIYAVTDEDGQAALNGPSRVPPALLRPILRALDKASVSEFSISTGDIEPQIPMAEVEVAVAVTPTDIEEYEEPRHEAWSPVIIAVKVV
ncbi:hypothetical protein CSIV_06930 [Microbacterium sp. CSI-V]|uniref:hypothetical protein n=1 Tax=unclassified Microbacterium TaxID=2609290 RepID=UPI00097BFA5E|nr:MULTISPECIES: hypothetical protein [unclassified Microbacterium]MXS76218.1 hypothetical protein [Microbacterium sp. TL13]ONI64486.1 hypothetical protein CSIV_06930 [Microbacterium sp. CSI-V]